MKDTSDNTSNTLSLGEGSKKTTKTKGSASNRTITVETKRRRQLLGKTLLDKNKKQQAEEAPKLGKDAIKARQEAFSRFQNSQQQAPNTSRSSIKGIKAKPKFVPELKTAEVLTTENTVLEADDSSKDVAKPQKQGQTFIFKPKKVVNKALQGEVAKKKEKPKFEESKKANKPQEQKPEQPKKPAATFQPPSMRRIKRQLTNEKEELETKIIQKKQDEKKRLENEKQEELAKQKLKEELAKKDEKSKTLLPKRGGLGGSRRQRKITVTTALNADDERQHSLASVKRRRAKDKRHEQASDVERIKREIVLPESITVQELANRITEKTADVVKELMKIGVMATATQTIDADTAELVVTEMGHTIKQRVSESDLEDSIIQIEDSAEDLLPRPPVVTIMGHVDHGKTTLLDAIRSTNVVAKESGGITQHIGAYQVSTKDGQLISFVDTPGHAAFTEMRARGANITDIVILVVAADDGIMPQTIEAINHAQAAKVPLIVAINKMDSVGADPEKIRNMLLSHNVVVEQFSGDVLSVEVSALKRQGLDELLEAVLLQADMMSLQANPNRSAMGTVVESKMEMGRGSVATVLVQHGTLKIGDVFITGQQWGKVRALFDDQGNKINQALPSSPVEVLGLNGSPSAGDDLIVVESEAKAREITDHRLEKLKSKKAAAMTNIEAMFSQIKDGQRLEVPVVIKADVHGSAEVIKSSLEKISNDEVKITAIHVSVGGITESDITLAKASNALVIAFNVRANAQAKRLAEQEQIDVRYYSIIYNLIDDVKDIISGKLEPERKEIFLGYAEIREVFNVSKVGKVAGCYVTEGEIKRGCNVRLLRDNVVIHEGSLKTLKRHKDEVKEVKHGYECGMGFENYQDIRNGDFIECFEIQEFARTLA